MNEICECVREPRKKCSSNFWPVLSVAIESFVLFFSSPQLRVWMGAEQLLLKCQQPSFDSPKNTDYSSIPIECRITRSHQRSVEIRLHYLHLQKFDRFCSLANFDFIQYYWELSQIHTTLYSVFSDWIRLNIKRFYSQNMIHRNDVMFWGFDANPLY